MSMLGLLRRQPRVPWMRSLRCFADKPQSPEPTSEAPRELRQTKQGFTNISYSPLRMNVVAKLLRRLTVPEAIAQATFSPKKGAKAALSLLEKCSELAKQKHGLIPEELYVEKLLVNQGPGTKRIKIMGRGRTGMSFIRKSHLKLTLTEIDFDLAIASASSANQKAKWTKRRDAIAALKAAEVTE